MYIDTATIFHSEKAAALSYARWTSYLPNEIYVMFCHESMYLCVYTFILNAQQKKTVCFQKEHWSIMYVRSMKFSHYTQCQCSMLHAVSILFPSMLLESIEVKTSWKESSVFAPLVSIIFKSDAQTQLFKICEWSAK